MQFSTFGELLLGFLGMTFFLMAYPANFDKNPLPDWCSLSVGHQHNNRAITTTGNGSILIRGAGGITTAHSKSWGASKKNFYLIFPPSFNAEPSHAKKQSAIIIKLIDGLFYFVEFIIGLIQQLYKTVKFRRG